jgi:hypothetical protein
MVGSVKKRKKQTEILSSSSTDGSHDALDFASVGWEKMEGRADRKIKREEKRVAEGKWR